MDLFFNNGTDGDKNDLGDKKLPSWMMPEMEGYDVGG